MTDDLHGWRTAAYKATRERDEALATIARVREFAASNALQPWVRERLADALDPPPPACPRCHGRGKVPDWSQGLDAEFGEPQAKPCPDCQAEPI